MVARQVRTWIFLAGVLAVLTGEAAAQAPPAGQSTVAGSGSELAAPLAPLPSAAALRAAGARAAKAQKYEACVEAYSMALALEPDGATMGELGLCEEALGRSVDAYNHVMDALAREVPASPPEVRAQWERFRGAALRLEWRTGRVLLSVSPPGAEVFLDGKPLGRFHSGRIITVPVGKHRWTARLPRKPDVVVEHELRGGDMPDIALIFPVERPPAPAPPCAAPVPAPPPLVPCATMDDLPMSIELCNALTGRWRRMDPTLGLVAGGLLSLGFTPDVGPGFFVGGEAHFRRQEEWGFQAGAEARFILPTYGGQTSTGSTSLNVTLMELAVAPCVRYKWAFGCAVITPGVALSGGDYNVGPDGADLGAVPIFVMGVGPRLGVDIPVLEQIGIRAFGELRFGPLPGTGYKVNDTIIWEEPKVSGFVGLAVAYR